MKFIKLFIALSISFVSVFILSVFAFGFFLNIYFQNLSLKEFTINETLVDLPFGTSLRRASTILAEQHVIPDANKFFWYWRLFRADSAKIQAGYYNFEGTLTYREIADRLLTGRDQSFRITFKEGQTLVDLVNDLEALMLVSKDQFIAAMTSDDVVSTINVKPANARHGLENDVGGIEGYLFPDTYFFAKRDTASTIIKKMYQRLLDMLDQNIRARMEEQNVSLHELLTLASIIEKETGDPAERAIISSVYHNRLKIGMRLQADPTVVYGLKNYDGKIRKADLLAYHPYNTYKIAGLPPGPIASVGIEAIRAALWPLNTNYFYFVSRNDGTHVFCEDFSCHNKAVRKWQIEYAKNK